jgi:hypothetical protein
MVLASLCMWYGLQVRATHGAHQGTWYFEVDIRRLGSTGHARIGWATRSAELQAPVRQHPVQASGQLSNCPSGAPASAAVLSLCDALPMHAEPAAP